MSGMRRSSQSAPPTQRELVYCHQCQNEFYKDEHGLQCPECGSVFVEMIEHDHDPRGPDMPPHSFAGFNPWENAPDPDEDDIGAYTHPGQHHFPNMLPHARPLPPVHRPPLSNHSARGFYDSRSTAAPPPNFRAGLRASDFPVATVQGSPTSYLQQSPLGGSGGFPFGSTSNGSAPSVRPPFGNSPLNSFSNFPSHIASYAYPHGFTGLNDNLAVPPMHPNPIFHSFAQMLNNMNGGEMHTGYGGLMGSPMGGPDLGARPFPMGGTFMGPASQSPIRGSAYGGGEPSRGQTPFSSTGEDQRESSRPRSEPGSPRRSSGRRTGQPHIQIWSNSGPGYSFTATTTTRSMGGANGEDPFPGLGSLIEQMFGGLVAAAPNGRAGLSVPAGAHGNPGEQLSSLLQQIMMGPGAQGNPGDYASTQEAFDRIMSQLMEQTTGSTAPGPASDAAIKALEKRPADKALLGSEKADCSVCMLEVNATDSAADRQGDLVTVLPCKHWFHPECVEAWLHEHDTCPICRAGIMPKEGEQTTVRRPDQEPLHNADPALLARRQSMQSGSQENPILVPESPSSARRYSAGQRRHSSASSSPSLSRQSTRDRPGSGGGAGGTGGFFSRARNMFSGTGNNNGGGGGRR